jgi:penicillin-binding protein 1A
MEMIDTLPPGAQGEDEGVGHPNDFIDMPNREYIPAESQPVIDENKKVKKDTATEAPKIGEMDKNDKQKKKKGFFQKIFGKKDK